MTAQSRLKLSAALFAVLWTAGMIWWGGDYSAAQVVNLRDCRSDRRAALVLAHGEMAALDFSRGRRRSGFVQPSPQIHRPARSAGGTID